MRLNIIIYAALLLPAYASWFSGEKPEYQSWDAKQLKYWLKTHNISPPSSFSEAQLKDLVKANWYSSATSWTKDQYPAAQHAFKDVKDDSFQSWDESRLRKFLLDQGIIAPKGPKESLVQSAKSIYSSYTSVASDYSSRVSAAASTAVHGDEYWQARKSAKSAASTASSLAAAASQDLTQDLMRKIDQTKDYVYSTWDDNRMRTYLEEKGIIDSKQKVTRNQLLAYMYDAYAAVANPVWEAWSNSYMHEWLVHHGIMKSEVEKSRDELRKLMQRYYYGAHDKVWDTWSESDLKNWLVAHNIIKPESKAPVDKMRKLVRDNYMSAMDTMYGSWKTSDMRTWLIDHNFLKSDAQIKKEELVNLFHEKYDDVSARTAAYLGWPDARLRIFLRNSGLSDTSLPTTREELLREVRLRYNKSASRGENLYNRIVDTVQNGWEKAEEKLGDILSVIGGASEEVKLQTQKAHLEAAKSAEAAARSAASAAQSLSAEAAKESQKAKSEL